MTLCIVLKWPFEVEHQRHSNYAWRESWHVVWLAQKWYKTGNIWSWAFICLVCSCWVQADSNNSNLNQNHLFNIWCPYMALSVACLIGAFMLWSKTHFYLWSRAGRWLFFYRTLFAICTFCYLGHTVSVSFRGVDVEHWPNWRYSTTVTQLFISRLRALLWVPNVDFWFKIVPIYYKFAIALSFGPKITYLRKPRWTCFFHLLRFWN